MALIAVYERFLASPNPLSLSENVALHYVPTLTSYSQSGPIIRHLESQNKDVVKIKSRKTLGAVEGSLSIAIELDTTLEFLSGGGAYLPKLDSFVVVDKIATLPMTHIVQFDSDQKISQIRISWDQASLLKQTEVIGSRGRNWPVFDGKDQVKLVASSVSNTTATAPVMPTSPASPRGRGSVENGHGVRNPSPGKKVVKDPYTSLDTFWTQENEQGASHSKANAVIAPRAESFKPPPRNMSEIFAAGHEDNEPGSPKKSHVVPVVAPKGGSTKKFGPARLFDEDEEAGFTSPKIYKTNPARYNHFDIGDAPEHDPLQHNSSERTQEPKTIPLTARTNKHASQWDFSDFMTPAKVALRERPGDQVHFSLEDDNKAAGDSPSNGAAAHQPRRDAEPNFEFKDDGTPIERKVIPKPRKDAQTHFEFDDQPTPAPARIIARTEAAKGLYRNVLEENDQPLSDISNNAGRRNDFGNHWQMNDASPAGARMDSENTGIGHTRDHSVQKMGANWEHGDQSPEQTKRPTSKAYKKQGLEPQWGVNATTEQEQPGRGKSRGGQKGFWDF